MLIVFGSVNADLVFTVPALPKPGETVLCEGHRWAAGGKGANQAVAAARAGSKVRFFGRIGADENGTRLRELLAREGIDTTGLASSARPTGIAIIAVDGQGENSIVVASGANLDATAAQVPDALLSAGATLLCQNEVPPHETLTLLARAKQRHARTVLNVAPARGLDLVALHDVDVLIVNEHEAAMLTGHEAVEPAARALAAGREAVIITLGAHGALAADAGRLIRLPAIEVDVVDTTGAGDAFVGVLAAALDEAVDLATSIARAIVASGLACEQLGAQTASPSRAAIEERLSRSRL